MQIRLRNRSLRNRRFCKILGALFALGNEEQTARVPQAPARRRLTCGFTARYGWQPTAGSSSRYSKK